MIKRTKKWIRALLPLPVALLVCWARAEPLPMEPMLTPPPSDGPVEVRVGFDLQDIHTINDENETFSFSGILTLRWKDHRLAFDPEESGCLEKIYNGAFQFNRVSPSWFPQLIPINTAGMHKSHGVLLRVAPDGSCIQTEMITTDARTDFDLIKFPFDAQRLEVHFGILGFNRQEVVLVPSQVNGYREDKLLRVAVPQWKLTGLDLRDNSASLDNHSSVTMSLTVHRHSFFIVRLVVIPLMVICMLSWSVFWMEQSSLGNRMSASFVGILTAVSFQTMVGNLLPQIAYFTRIHAFLAVTFFLMCATAVINLLVGAFDRKGQHVLAHQIDRRCRWIFPVLYAGGLLVTAVLG